MARSKCLPVSRSFRNQRYRGDQKAIDRTGHHRHRNYNNENRPGFNQINYIKFDCKVKQDTRWIKQNCYKAKDFYLANEAWRYYDRNIMRQFNWKIESFQQFLTKMAEDFIYKFQKQGPCKIYRDSLKQILRRGCLGRFQTHRKGQKRINL